MFGSMNLEVIVEVDDQETVESVNNRFDNYGVYDWKLSVRDIHGEVNEVRVCDANICFDGDEYDFE